MISYLDTKNEISLKMFIVFYLFSPSIWRPWSFLPLSPACAWNCMVPLSSCWPTCIVFFLALPISFIFSVFFPSFPLFSFFLSLSVSFPFLFSFFLAPPFVTQETPRPQSPHDTPLPLCSLYPPGSLCLLFFVVLSSRKFQSTLQKVERCCLLTFLPYFFDFPLVKYPPMPCRLILCVSIRFDF